MAADNTQYKDRLFNFLFGSEENRAWTLSLYNAVNKSNYTDPSLIEITTIKEIMYLGMQNDTSFLISDEMDLYEQQSSYNPNMPLRLMQYAGNLYEKYIRQTKQNKYGKNRELMASCKPLAEYSWLVAEVRKNNETKDEDGASSAIDKAITAMPDDFVIKPFLEAHRVEVKGMLLAEYNEAETMELFKEDGRKEKEIEDIRKVMEKLKYTAQQAMDFLDVPHAERSQYMTML